MARLFIGLKNADLHLQGMIDGTHAIGIINSRHRPLQRGFIDHLHFFAQSDAIFNDIAGEGATGNDHMGGHIAIDGAGDGDAGDLFGIAIAGIIADDQESSHGIETALQIDFATDHKRFTFFHFL